MVSKEYSNDIDSSFYQPSDSIHPVSFPFSSVSSTVVPIIHTESLSLILDKIAIVRVICRPAIVPFSVLHPFGEVAYVFSPVHHGQFSESSFEIVFPISFVHIAIFVEVGPMESFIVPESASEKISVEKDQFALNFGIVFPPA